jgi:hypothetical protein
MSFPPDCALELRVVKAFAAAFLTLLSCGFGEATTQGRLAE